MSSDKSIWLLKHWFNSKHQRPGDYEQEVLMWFEVGGLSSYAIGIEDNGVWYEFQGDSMVECPTAPDYWSYLLDSPKPTKETKGTV